MKRKIEAVEVRTTFKTDNWRGITDENGVFYNVNNPDFIKYIAIGGTYEIEFEEYVPTRGKYKGKKQNKITNLKILSVVEQEENPAQEQTREVADTKRGATSLPVPVTQKHEVATVQRQPTTVKDQIFQLIPTVGTIKLTEEEEKILYAPVNPEDVEIRPDGLIYLPWMEYVTRLRKAFGMSWGIISTGKPEPMGVYIMWPFYLLVRGKLMSGPAIGEQKYQPNNPKMTWGDACEGAKSNALMRLCKGLGISLELWQPRFIKDWVSKHAESYELKDAKGKKKLNNKGEVIIRWRKKK